MGSPTARRQSAHWSLQWRRRSRPKVEESTSTFCSTNHGIAVMPRFYFGIRKGVRFSVDMPQARQVDHPDKQRRRKWDCDHRISVAAGQVRTGRHRKPETFMRIEAVDFFYLSMPEVTDRGGRQPGCAARAGRGGRPRRLGRMRGLAAASRSPPSSARCRMASAGRSADSVLGSRSTNPADIAPHGGGGRLQQHGSAAGRPHLVGRRDGAVGSARQGARRAGLAAARLSPQSSEDALCLAAVRRHAAGDARTGAPTARAKGFRAAKFGWGPIGRGSAQDDADHFAAAREGLGADGILLVDAGQIFGEDVEARRRAAAGARGGRRTLARGAVRRPVRLRPMAALRGSAAGKVRLAGGEGGAQRRTWRGI